MIKLNTFDFEGYQVVKLKDIERELTASNYKNFLAFLEGQTMTIDENNNTLIFYFDFQNWVHNKLINFNKFI